MQPKFAKMTIESTMISGALAAAGSLPQVPWRAQPSRGRRVRLGVEMALLFVATPFLMAYAIHTFRVPLTVLLQPIVAGFLIYLLLDRSFDLRRELARGFRLRELIWIVALFFVVSALVSMWVWLNRPEDFLAFPTARPWLWATVMLLYPLLSALPQELIYRTFFFHRYGALFGDRRWLAIAVNGALFGFGHVIFDSAVSVILSGVLGVLLAYRYTENRSVWAVWIEHLLYGQLVFTVGLGRYFFTGVSLL
jgi:uncharacterized protein